MFIDSHAHLDRCNYLDGLFQDNLETVVHISLNPQEFLDNHHKLQDPRIHFATGFYPDHAALEDFCLDQAMADLKNVLTNYKHCALGEIGIDLKSDEYGSLEKQTELFERQIILAKELDLPITIHSRMSFNEVFSSLQKYNHRCIFHCFSYGVDEAKKILDRGDFISLAGLLTYPKLTELQDVARMIPLDQVLFETDSPYLSPVPLRGKPNSPNNVHYIYHYFSEIRQIPIDELCQIIKNNFNKAFSNL